MRAPLLVLSAVLLCGCPRVRFATVERGEAGPVLYAGVRLFDGEAFSDGRDVLVEGGRISWVGPAGARPAPPGVRRVAGAGRTLLPGLVDAHVHLSATGAPPWRRALPDAAASARALLFCGVTTALVAAGDRDEDALDREGAAGATLAPHLFRAGPGLTAPGGHPIPFIRALVPWPISSLAAWVQPTAATPEEARAAVRRIRQRHGPPLFKIFYDDIPPGAPRLSREALGAAIAEARAQGMRPVVHIGAAADMVTAAELGASLLMHPPSRDTLSEAQIARLRALGVPFVTTSRVLRAQDEVARGATALERALVDGETLAAFSAPPPGFALEGFGDSAREFPLAAARMADNTRRLIAAGVPFLAGSDTGVFGVFPGAGLHGELRALAELGLAPAAVLRAATSAAADFLDPTRSFGRVAPGQRADLLLVRGDAGRDLTALADIEEVLLAGLRLERRPLRGGR